jgi:site-specific DNA-methyltransferase (cytosine-N4-specific)
MNQMSPAYHTALGAAYTGDSLDLLSNLSDDSVDLVFTSPPFALQRQKAYGNKAQDEYVEWLLSFGPLVHRVLKQTGSFVIDMGGAYEKGRPVRSVYQYRYLIRMVDEIGFRLAEEFYWFNSAKLPSPIEWVNKRKIRAKDAVNTLWWFSKGDFPKANVTNVLAPFSDRMKKLLENPKKWYTPKKRPSGHDIGARFGDLAHKEGAIPSNLLQIPNTESNSLYLRCCKAAGVSGHPARFPERLPEFFIKFLTDAGDVVLDIFAGSNTTGATAEKLGRRWISFELDREYVGASVFRFLGDSKESTCRTTMAEVITGDCPFLETEKTGAVPSKNGRTRKRRTRAAETTLFG